MTLDKPLETRITQVITPSLEDLGYELVRVHISGDHRHKIVQLMIDRTDEQPVSLDDCEKASRQVSAVLDVEEASLDKYHLEVSSPGIDRPLTRLKDFARFAGQEAKMEVFEKVKEQRKLRGKLAGVSGDKVRIALNVVALDKPEEVEYVETEFSNIKAARLVLNDELLAIKK